MQKGISPLIGAVLLVVVSVSIGTIMLSFMTSVSTTESKKISNSLTDQLTCQYASYYLKNVTVNCNNNCATGTAHTLNMTAVNSGKRSVNITAVYVINTTGSIIIFEMNETKKLGSGNTVELLNITTESCSPYNQTIDRIEVPNTICSNVVAVVENSDITFLNC